jgi:ABC-2 type transport system permease protein
MRGLGILLRKEWLESWRTYRLPVIAGLFVLVGLTSPLLARYLPEIIEVAAGDTLGAAIPIPTPTAVDAVVQVQKNLAQFGALAAILLAMGSVASELERGTAAFVLARPVRRGTFLVAKAISIGLILALCVGLAVAIGWIYTAILFEPQPVDGWIAMALLGWLALCAWGALTFLASAVTGSALAAAGLGFVAFLVLSLVAVVPAIARWTPAGLTVPATELATGASTVADLGVELWLPVVATTLLIALAVGGAHVAFGRREL